MKHYTRWHRHGDPMTVSRTPPLAPDATEKVCPRCGQTKLLRFFGMRTTGTRKGYCRECEVGYNAEYLETPHGRNHKRSAGRAWKNRNAAQVAARLYGITVDDYDAMLDRQNGRCAICRTDKVGGNATRWHIDHDHTTGTVRGLLCMKCNLGLGYFGDDHRRLIDACIYLGAVPSSPIGFFEEVS